MSRTDSIATIADYHTKRVRYVHDELLRLKSEITCCLEALSAAEGEPVQVTHDMVEHIEPNFDILRHRLITIRDVSAKALLDVEACIPTQKAVLEYKMKEAMIGFNPKPIPISRDVSATWDEVEEIESRRAQREIDKIRENGPPIKRDGPP